MEKLAWTIEDLLEKELALYKELQNILEQEKHYIVDMDVDSLWKTIVEKKQIALKLESMDKKIFNLLEKRSAALSMESKTLKLSDFILKLPVSRKIKSKLRRIKLGLETYKENVSTLALANKTYINESLAVINNIFSVVVEKVNQEQYNNCGNILENREKKRFISAEV
ncbi:MAG: flagellar protein FlgN [Desulfobacula sp.]|nr:flagellar protein FlgN [Desulfobacula sp.]